MKITQGPEDLVKPSAIKFLKRNWGVIKIIFNFRIQCQLIREIKDIITLISLELEGVLPSIIDLRSLELLMVRKNYLIEQHSVLTGILHSLEGFRKQSFILTICILMIVGYTLIQGRYL